MKTSDQKLFIINGVGKFIAGTKIAINFFLKFDELGVIPNIKRVFIDYEQVCVKGLIEQSENFETTSNESDTTSMAPIVDYTNIKLSDLPIKNFPNVTKIPSIVDNVGTTCLVLQFQIDFIFPSHNSRTSHVVKAPTLSAVE